MSREIVDEPSAFLGCSRNNLLRGTVEPPNDLFKRFRFVIRGSYQGEPLVIEQVINYTVSNEHGRERLGSTEKGSHRSFKEKINFLIEIAPTE